MRIGVIGAGMIGSTVGRLWTEAGHEVRFATRHPDQLTKLVAEIGKNASAGTTQDALRFADVMFVAIPLKAWPALAQEAGADLDGKVVIDASNPYAARDGALADQVTSGGGTGVYFSRLLPKSRLVRAFNTVYYQTLRTEAHRTGAKVAIPIAGDDPTAVDLVGRLVRDAGFDPVVVGPLRDAYKFDVGTVVYNKAQTAADVRRALGLAEST